jgi:hypothetical protein
MRQLRILLVGSLFGLANPACAPKAGPDARAPAHATGGGPEADLGGHRGSGSTNDEGYDTFGSGAGSSGMGEAGGGTGTSTSDMGGSRRDDRELQKKRAK